MGGEADDDLAWLDEEVRRNAQETLKALFSSGRMCLMTFDAHGQIIGVNPHTTAFGSQPQTSYQGLNLLEHPTLRRLGWSAALARVLAGHTVEVVDSRWVTLFSGEERWVDASASPVRVDDSVVGGVACLIDATEMHRAAVGEQGKRLQARELELFLVRDIAQPLERLEAADELGSDASALAELRTLFEDLKEFLQLGAYQPRPVRLLMVDVLRAAGVTTAPRAPQGQAVERIAVLADARLLRRVLRNLHGFAKRAGSGAWFIAGTDGRVVLDVEVGGSPVLLQELLLANSLSMAEASGADGSLAAARWMTEMMGGTLTVRNAESVLRVTLPAAEPAR